MMCQKPAFLALTLNSHWPSLECLEIKLDLTKSFQVIQLDTSNGGGNIDLCTDLLRGMFPKKLIQK